MRQYVETLAERDRLIGALERFLTRWDAWLCPVMATPAIPHCPTGTPIAVDEQTLPYWVAGVAYTTPFNLTGSPVVVDDVPRPQIPDGLPGAR